MSPSITVITPVYNAAAYIAETVRSVACELATADQYIVCDDGSTDGSAEIVSGLGLATDSIRQTNGGEAAAVNAGVDIARHDIIGIVNADDPVLPGLLAAVRAAFAADPALAGVYPDWRKIDANGHTIADIVTCEYDYRVMLAEHMCIPGPGAFFRRSVVNGAPVRDHRVAGITDYDFWLRFGRHGAKIRRIPQTLACWRLHRQGATIAAQGLQLAKDKIAAIENLFAEGDLPDDLRALERRALSAAYYQAALVGLRAAGVPSFRYAMQSIRLAPVWPADVLPHQKRALPHLAYAALQPLSGVLHQALSHCLPPRLRRQAVLDQVFGIDVPPSR